MMVHRCPRPATFSIKFTRFVPYSNEIPSIYATRRRTYTSEGVIALAPDQTESRRRNISTFNPRRLQPADFVDLSGKRWPAISVHGSPPISLHRSALQSDGRYSDYRYPENTRGFLYYHRDPSRPLTTGEIRFRITLSDDPLQFDAGKDLKDSSDRIWALDIVNLTRLSYKPVLDALIRDNLVDVNVFEKIKEHVPRSVRPETQSLEYLDQPFTLHLHTHPFIRVFGPSSVGFIRPQLFVDNRALKKVLPYAGSLLVRFERSNLLRHVHANTVVLRILRIIQPVKVAIPGYDMYLPMPEAGRLLLAYKTGGKGLREYAVNLDKPSKRMAALKLLPSLPR